MDVQQSPSASEPKCHRCDTPMTFHKKEIVKGKTMLVFRCQYCETLEAVQIAEAA